MPDLDPIPLIAGDLDLSAEITDNWISTVQATIQDVLGIATVEEWVPPTPGAEVPFRAYTRTDLPGVAVYVSPSGSEPLAAAMVDEAYRVTWYVIVEGGAPKTTHRLHSRIRENLLALFGANSYLQGSSQFLNRSGVCVTFDDYSFGDSEYAESPYVLYSRDSMRCRVSMPDPVVG